MPLRKFSSIKLGGSIDTLVAISPTELSLNADKTTDKISKSQSHKKLLFRFIYAFLSFPRRIIITAELYFNLIPFMKTTHLKLETAHLVT
jgi:hypothetical protein